MPMLCHPRRRSAPYVVDESEISESCLSPLDVARRRLLPQVSELTRRGSAGLLGLTEASLGAMMSEIRRFKTKPRAQKRAGGSDRARARHLLLFFPIPTILRVQYALAPPLPPNTSAAIAASTNSETSTLADPIRKEQSIFLTASQHGRQVLQSVTFQFLQRSPRKER